jgi:hypothetical protein
LPDEDEDEDEDENEDEDESDDSLPTTISSAIVPATNDCVCAHCGNPKYSIAERDGGIACWKCGLTP